VWASKIKLSFKDLEISIILVSFVTVIIEASTCLENAVLLHRNHLNPDKPRSPTEK
jgi:hypothetical protein